MQSQSNSSTTTKGAPIWHTKVRDPAQEALGGPHSRGGHHFSPTQSNQHLRAIQEEANGGHRQPLSCGLVRARPKPCQRKCCAYGICDDYLHSMTDCYSLMAFQCVNKSVLQLLIRKKALQCATASKVTHKQLTEYTNLEQGLSSTHNKAFEQWCTRCLIGRDQTPQRWDWNRVTAGLGVFNDWQCTQCTQ